MLSSSFFNSSINEVETKQRQNETWPSVGGGREKEGQDEGREEEEEEEEEVLT